MESTNESVNATTMDKKQLLEAVRHQVEYYFSKENLQSDIYLTSQMDANNSVPLAVVMKFAKLKALTQDENIVREALADSTITSVVDNRIKATVKPAGRSTIILREIPSDAPVEEVKEIFNYEGCKPIGTIRSDIGDTWFVSMDTEEDAKDTLLDLRLKKRTFRGQPIKARIKTETVIRSFYPLPTAPVMPTGYAGYPMQVPMPMDMRAFGYSLPTPNEPVIIQDVVVPTVDVKSVPHEESVKPNTTTPTNNANNKSSHVSHSKDNKDNRGGNKGNTQSTSKTGSKDNTNNSGSNNNNRKNDNTRNTKGSASHNRKEEPARPRIEINSANFPPLSSDDKIVPTPGYKDAYNKYSFEEVLAIVKEVKEATLPSSLNPSQHPLALTATPNLDLLKKQRTYSIDETREQLRQGRPVHREAITAGAVDIHSFIYGDEAHQPSATSNVAPSSHAVEAAPVPAPAATTSPSKHVTKSRSGSHDIHNQTPKKISQSTWAAMVKSSAAATEGTTVAPSSVTKATQSEKSPVNDASKKSPVAPKDANKSGGEKSGDKKKSKGGESSSGANKEGNNKPEKEGGGNRRDRKRNAAKDGATTSIDDNKETEGHTATETGAVPPSEASEGVAGGAWGGKATFANIVKLKSTEEGETSPINTPPKQDKPTSATSNNNNNNNSNKGTSGKSNTSKQSSGSKASGDSSNKEGGSGGHGRRNRNNNNGSSPDRGTRKSSSNNSSSTSGANSSGVWVKETLPALKK